MLEGLTAMPRHGAPSTLCQPAGQKLALSRGYPRNEHPGRVRRAGRGPRRKVLFVFERFTSRIVQLSAAESSAVLEMLYRIVELTPSLVCRMPWTPNSVVFWDNRCTQHHAV